MDIVEKVIMNLKIRPNGMSLTELNEICFATYQKTLIGSKFARLKALMVPTLKYLEETDQIILFGNGIVKLKSKQ
ncbi:hypothetical protein CLPUN_06880 [Clostridium puniceum]|uniref:Uncharacterized protein n=1 Tax=Clostridium puniceum TaxID=29367 RepID=A0A1S8TW18_9CLOT|nr:hypothetical protein [Clostridium puniceum]OOM81953.1 hypothetical protein CLPUN_06880 [Clostridium puniceum]